MASSNLSMMTYGKQLVALGKTLQVLREEDDADTLINATVSYLSSQFSYQLLWIGLYDRIDHRLLGKGGIAPTSEDGFLRQRFVLNSGDLFEQVAIQQRPVGVKDLREETRAGEWHRIAERIGIQGTIVFPIRHKDRCFGVALLGSKLWGVSPHSDEKARLSIVLGVLGASLDRLEIEWQRANAKRPHDPLLHLLSQLPVCETLDRGLEAVVEETHTFLKPARTNVYWLEPAKEYFWRRVGNRQTIPISGEETRGVSGIAFQEVRGFYQALMNEHLVAIGEARSSLKTDATTRLMFLIRARSLLAAPILCQDELLGFIAVEGNEPRIWQDEEKKYLQAAAKLLGLMYPLFQTDEADLQTKLEQTLIAGFAQAIYSREDLEQALKNCSSAIRQNLKVDRFFVLQRNADLDIYEVFYQSKPHKSHLVANPLRSLDEVDAKLLRRKAEAIEIENWGDDLRMIAWKDNFVSAGVRSFLLYTADGSKKTDTLVAIGHDTPRLWTISDREILSAIGQQIGFVLHQWNLHRTSEEQHQLYSILQGAFTTLQPTTRAEQLEYAALESIVRLLDCPLACSLTWSPGESFGRISSSFASSPEFNLPSDVRVPLNDEIIEWSLANTSLVGPFWVRDLPEATRQWLSAPVTQVWVMAMHTTTEHEILGLVLLGNVAEHRWSQRHLTVVEALVRQLAWSRRYSLLTASLSDKQLALESLNWYKNRRVEQLYRSIGAGIKQLSALTEGDRAQQILQQMGQSLKAIAPVLKEEQWQLAFAYTSVPLASVLKRLLSRLQPLFRQRQIWSQVHKQENFFLECDGDKIEPILYEVFLDAYRRSPEQGRIDIWCRPGSLATANGKPLVEISITDDGRIAEDLLHAFKRGRNVDWLAPSILELPPGLNLTICQSLLQKMGGDLSLAQLEDGRSLSRILLPLAKENSE